MSGVAVIAEGESLPEPETPATSAPGPRSPLAVLHGKRRELEARLYKDLKVPRWDEVLDGRSLWVRYRPIDVPKANVAAEKREKAHKGAVSKGGHGDPDWIVKANADALAAACVAIYDLGAGEEPPDELPAELPTFGSRELSESLGAEPNAVATVLKVYGTSADVQLAFAELLGWSGQTSEEARQAFLAGSETTA